MSDIDATAEKLIEVLANKKKYLQDLQKLAIKQKQALINRDPETLTGLQDARDEVIAKINSLSHWVPKPLGREDAGTGNAGDTAGNHRSGFVSTINDLERDIYHIALEINRMDQENIAAAREFRELLKKDIEDIAAFRQSQEAYKKQKPRLAGVFLNEER